MSWVRTVDIDYQQISYLSQQVTVKRIDKVHEFISGNKFYKLKYNLQYAQEQGYRQIVSFGGAYSNHIYALAHACHEQGLDNIAIIRGDELAHKPLNHTLSQVQALGTQLVFISRQQYRNKHTAEFLSHLRQTYPNAYIIPEGGSNELAIQGTAEIISEEDKENFSHICCAVGTGGTIAGIINASSEQQQVIGFSALNTTYQADDINKWTTKSNWSLYADDVFGGYARYDQRLIDFIEEMKHRNGLPLEPIYTGKALYRLLHWLEESWLEKKQRLEEQANPPQSSRKVLFIHTGGLSSYQHSAS